MNPEEVTVKPEASCLCSGQGSIQAVLRPGVWFPGIRSLHLYKEQWKVSANPVVCAKDVLQAVNLLRTVNLRGNVFTVSYVKEDQAESRVEIIVFSRMRYVFVIELNFVADESGGGCFGDVRAFASGIMPAWVPLGFLFSCFFSFFPFPDFGYNEVWVNILKSRITIPVEVIKKGRSC